MVGVVAAADKADAVLAELTAAGVVPETSGNAIKDMSGQAVKVRTPQVPPVSSLAQQPRAVLTALHVTLSHCQVITELSRLFACAKKWKSLAGMHPLQSSGGAVSPDKLLAIVQGDEGCVQWLWVRLTCVLRASHFDALWWPAPLRSTASLAW